MSNEDFPGGGDPGFFDVLYRRFLDDPHAVPRDLARTFVRIAASDGSLDGARAAPAGNNGQHIVCEFPHIQDPVRRDWLAAAVETRDPVSRKTQKRILSLLVQARDFEDTLYRRLPGVKTFGLAGSESFLVAIEGVLWESVEFGTKEVVIGGMHRGRLSQLALVFGKPLAALIAETMGAPAVSSDLNVASDVPYHLGWSGHRQIGGRRVALSVMPHPSHLSVISPVALGKARGKQKFHGQFGAQTVLPLLLHTDAAFSGQGVIAETFQLSRLPSFLVGGAVHLVLNNGIGFTTEPEAGRSSRYCTDVAKATQTPVLHVDGDDPEAVLQAARIAARYRAHFHDDIVVAINGHRRRGHNELDEPRFTQPLMYTAIDRRPGVDEIYAASTGLATDAVRATFRESLDMAFDAAVAWKAQPIAPFAGHWSGYRTAQEPDMISFSETGKPLDHLRSLARQITSVPETFLLSAKVARFLTARWQTVSSGADINWATAEALALASLAPEGKAIRLGGQDTARGPFSQRHLILHDQKSGQTHDILRAVFDKAGQHAEVFNTPLSEYAIVAFEYGLSLADPNRLTVWEAQFGDFLNVAQTVFDQFIACGEDRWIRSSGLTLLLPHGLDGGGPDHSTARPERLLAACAKGNIQVVNPSTPANYFHVLRRQMVRDFRKPLVILSPKSLLRHRGCVSRLADMGPGSGFLNVISDTGAKNAERVVLCSGKIYYELAAERKQRGLGTRIALVRIEQFYPFPESEVRDVLATWPTADLIWAQEEPANMGVFAWLDRRLEATAGRAFRLVSRPAAPTPAVGVKDWHEAERSLLINRALGLDKMP